MDKKYEQLLDTLEEIGTTDLTVEEQVEILKRNFIYGLPTVQDIKEFGEPFFELLLGLPDAERTLRALCIVYREDGEEMESEMDILDLFPSRYLFSFTLGLRITAWFLETTLRYKKEDYVKVMLAEYDEDQDEIFNSSVELAENQDIWSSLYVLYRKEGLNDMVLSTAKLLGANWNPLLKLIIDNLDDTNEINLHNVIVKHQCTSCITRYVQADEIKHNICWICTVISDTLDKLVNLGEALQDGKMDKNEFNLTFYKFLTSSKLPNYCPLVVYEPITDTPEQMKQYLRKYVQGQEDLVDKLSYMSYMYCKQVDMANEKEGEIAYPLSLMIGGNTGTGKTYTVDLLAERLNIPVIKIDATTLTPSGYVGDSVADITKKKAAEVSAFYKGKYPKHCKYIIFFDEIDKLLASSDNVQRFYSSVQTSMLKFVEKGMAATDEKFDHLAHPFVIFAGSFMSSRKKNSTVKESKQIGFNTCHAEPEEKGITATNLIEFGILPELVGRISTITETRDLVEKDYYDILTKKEGTALNKAQHLGQHIGIKFTKKDARKWAKEAAKQAVEQKTGVRGLETFFMNKLLSLAKTKSK